MKVYCLIESVDYEGDTLLGVYSSPEKAWPHLIAHLAKFRCDNEDEARERAGEPHAGQPAIDCGTVAYSVDEREVDAPGWWEAGRQA